MESIGVVLEFCYTQRLLRIEHLHKLRLSAGCCSVRKKSVFQFLEFHLKLQETIRVVHKLVHQPKGSCVPLFSSSQISLIAISWIVGEKQDCQGLRFIDFVLPLFFVNKYEKDAKKYWDIFYKRHQDRFFKDRHYLDKEWGHHFSGEGRQVILEVGCGAGNTIFPLLATYPDIFVHACDFSPRAVNLVKMHKEFTEARVNAFVCDLTTDDLSLHVAPSSVDIVTMYPQKKCLWWYKISRKFSRRPTGRILFRDYATGDLAQERFSGKEQKISENFYVRGDGTLLIKIHFGLHQRAFYFSDEFLRNLFLQDGFVMEEHVLCCKQVENRSKEIIMNRRWIQAVFRVVNDNKISFTVYEDEQKDLNRDSAKTKKDDANGFEIDMSEGMALEMFDISSSREEIVELSINNLLFKIKVLSKEYQHTCTSTGLMLWESARLMASILAANPGIIARKKVLELGCGCVGICSMIAARSADLVVATDGDPKALDLLAQNIYANTDSNLLDRLTVKKLEWGNKNDIEAVKKINEEGFDVIIGTDVTYVLESILPLFATAKELVSNEKGSVLVLCHVLRRVDEPSIVLAGLKYGFELVDRWPDQSPGGSPEGVIGNWICDDRWFEVPSTALNIMYFRFSLD
ncbi:methyltransferase [Striga asiatica]|uniref:Methyltransferase n=1 Tax=Striga asiatica TaxID=4170 RepID=A0A5A7PSC0_STRAF|nr:methyltransferase [Striga asiatica]